MTHVLLPSFTDIAGMTDLFGIKSLTPTDEYIWQVSKLDHSRWKTGLVSLPTLIHYLNQCWLNVNRTQEQISVKAESKYIFYPENFIINKLSVKFRLLGYRRLGKEGDGMPDLPEINAVHVFCGRRIDRRQKSWKMWNRCGSDGYKLCHL